MKTNRLVMVLMSLGLFMLSLGVLINLPDRLDLLMTAVPVSIGFGKK